MMLVEINLLPQKEPKKFALIVTLSSLLALFLIIGGVYYFQIHSVKNDMAAVDRQISITKKISANQENKAQSVESTSSVSQLKSAIDWANNYPIQTVPVMRYLTSLLPERGFIQSFGYTESGTVTLSVQFDSSREAAYFLDSLNQSKWIEEASLSSLSTTTIETNTASNTAVTNNQTSTTSATVNTNNTTSSTNDSSQNTTANNTNSVNQTNSNTTSTVVQNGQNGTTVNQNTQNASNGTMTNSVTTNGATPSNSTSSNNYLPRYTGSFEIKFNNDYVKKVIKQNKQDGEGVTGS